MDILRIASYLVAMAMAALGLWLSIQNNPADPAVAAPPPHLEVLQSSSETTTEPQ